MRGKGGSILRLALDKVVIHGVYRWTPRQESKTLLKKLSGLLAKKWEKPFSEVCGYVNAHMSIVIVRATHLCLCGSQIPMGKMSTHLPQWEDKAGLGLFRHKLHPISPTPHLLTSPIHPSSSYLSISMSLMAP
jgi:hypothetical protein